MALEPTLIGRSRLPTDGCRRYRVTAVTFDTRPYVLGMEIDDSWEDVVKERCSHCWTPCEAYPTILGNLARAAISRGPGELQPAHAETV